MTHILSKAGLLLGLALMGGCTTMGTGIGSTATGRDPVTFNWKSSDGTSGSMTADVAGKQTFAGPYFQITSTTTADTLGPLWAGWGGRWQRGGWSDWGGGPEFITHYSGRVVANLAAADGKHMRCHFRLIHPDDGMAGGGTGECQLPGGQQIDAQFPSA